MRDYCTFEPKQITDMDTFEKDFKKLWFIIWSSDMIYMILFNLIIIYYLG